MDKEQILSDRINGTGAMTGFKTANPVMCMTCKNASGQPPWADSPKKSYCIAFPREEGLRKPQDVYYDGADCQFYRGA